MKARILLFIAAISSGVLLSPSVRAQGDEVQEAIAKLGTQLEQREGYAPPPAVAALWKIVHHSARPGADEERRSCARALFTLLEASPALPRERREEIVRMLSIAACDATDVVRLAPLLADPDLAEAALFALERCAQPAAETVLLRQLESSQVLPRSAFAAALGARRSVAAVPALIALATGEDPAAPAARAALARIADPRAESVLREALARGEAGAGADLLLYLANRREQAEAILRGLEASYRELLAARLEATRVGAIHGLVNTCGAASAEALIAGLADPSALVRRTAITTLTELEDPALDGVLVQSIDGSSPTAHAGLLRVLHERGAESALMLILVAAAERDPELYPAAIELLGDYSDPLVTPVLLQAARTGGERARDAAASSLLRHARVHLAGERRKEALALLHAALNAAHSTAAAAPLIDELAALASPESLYPLDSWAARPEVREKVLSARLAIARALPASERERATEILRGVCSSSESRGTRRAAYSALETLGEDVSRIPLQAGFLVEWKVLGSFPKCDEKELATHPFPPGGPELSAPFEQGERKLAWRPMRSADPDGLIDLRALKPARDASAFAACTLEWPAAQRLTFMLGSDDGVAVWVNGKLVHENFVWRGVNVDEDRFEVPLKAGANTILVKINQGGGDWGFCLRLADEKGEPIDLAKRVR